MGLLTFLQEQGNFFGCALCWAAAYVRPDDVASCGDRLAAEQHTMEYGTKQLIEVLRSSLGVVRPAKQAEVATKHLGRFLQTHSGLASLRPALTDDCWQRAVYIAMIVVTTKGDFDEGMRANVYRFVTETRKLTS